MLTATKIQFSRYTEGENQLNIRKPWVQGSAEILKAFPQEEELGMYLQQNQSATR